MTAILGSRVTLLSRRVYPFLVVLSLRPRMLHGACIRQNGSRHRNHQSKRSDGRNTSSVSWTRLQLTTSNFRTQRERVFATRLVQALSLETMPCTPCGCSSIP
jgi:hypothetical protein